MKLINFLTLVLLNPDLSVFENSVDSDQLPSQKPDDQDVHCFPNLIVNTMMLKQESGKLIQCMKNGGDSRECMVVYKIPSMIRLINTARILV